eukprot:4353145-Pyramimonas_sp.AAC.1
MRVDPRAAAHGSGWASRNSAARSSSSMHASMSGFLAAIAPGAVAVQVASLCRSILLAMGSLLSADCGRNGGQ